MNIALTMKFCCFPIDIKIGRVLCLAPLYTGGHRVRLLDARNLMQCGAINFWFLLPGSLIREPSSCASNLNPKVLPAVIGTTHPM